MACTDVERSRSDDRERRRCLIAVQLVPRPVGPRSGGRAFPTPWRD